MSHSVSPPTGRRTLVSTLVVFALCSILAVSLAGPVAGAQSDDVGTTALADGEVQLSLESEGNPILPNETQTYDVVVEGADAGVSAYELTVSIADTDTGAITNYSLASNQTTFDGTDLADDGSTVSFEVATGADPLSSGTRVSVATVDVEPNQSVFAGSTTLAAGDAALIDNSSQNRAYTVTGTDTEPFSVGEPNENPVTVSLERPVETPLYDRSWTTFDIVVENTTDGISSVELPLTLDGGPATFVDFGVEKYSSNGFDAFELSADGTTFDYVTALGDNTYQPAQTHTIGTVTLRTEDVGTAGVGTSGPASVVDTTPIPYETTLDLPKLEIRRGPSAIPGYPNRPQDTDGDGLFEDVTGTADGPGEGPSIADVVALFRNLGSAQLNDDARFFQFNNPDDPTPDDVGISDVVTLFRQLGTGGGTYAESTARADGDGTALKTTEPVSTATLDAGTTVPVSDTALADGTTGPAATTLGGSTSSTLSGRVGVTTPTGVSTSSTDGTTDSTTRLSAETFETTAESAMLRLEGPFDGQAYNRSWGTYDIIAQNATSGIGSITLPLEIAGNGSIFSAYEVNRTSSSGFDVFEIYDNGTGFDYITALGDNTYPGAQQHDLGSVTFRTNGTGTVDIVLDPDQDGEGLSNESARAYQTTFDLPSFSVEEGPPSLPGYTNRPQDTDGDGLFEDLTGTASGPGDGPSIADVVAMFQNLGKPVLDDNAQFFRFNAPEEQDPDSVGIGDVVALFERV
jgi:hypothetical protein